MIARRVVPKFLFAGENLARGTVVAGVAHLAALGALLVWAPQLFRDTPGPVSFPITIQVFPEAYEEKAEAPAPELKRPADAGRATPPRPSAPLPPEAAKAAPEDTKSLAPAQRHALKRPQTPKEQERLDRNLRDAVDRNDVRKIEALLRDGAHPNAADGAGRDAIIAAAWRGRELALEFLIARGVDINVADNEGRTPLAWAAINGHPAIVEALLRYSADPEVADAAGLTPLMRAAWNGHLEVVRALLRAGAAPGRTTPDGRTALDLAREERWHKVAHLLERALAAN